MFAIIESGGKQYKAAKGDILKVEKLQGEAGATIELGNVLLIGDDKAGVTLGNPVIEGASISAEVVAQERSKKVIIFKKKRRQNYRRKNGHRQSLTVLRVTEINASGSAKKKAAPKPKKVEEKAEASVKKAPVKKTTTKKKED